MKASILQVPALPVLAGWIAGIFLYISGGTWLPAIISVTIGSFFLLLRRFYPWNIGLVALTCGWFQCNLAEPTTMPETLSGQALPYSLKVIEAKHSSTSLKILVSVDSVNAQAISPFRAEIYANPGVSVLPGEHIRTILTLQPAKAWNDLPGEPNLNLYYRRHGIAATAVDASSEFTAIGRDTSLLTVLSDYRERLLGRIAHSGINDNTFGLLAAILLGYSDDLPYDIQQNFSAAGVAHTLALSGFHVGIIILIINLALFPLRGDIRMRTPRLLITIILLWLYAALTGFPLSVVRAVIMASVYMVGKLAGIRINPFNSLCVAVLLIIVINPMSFFSPGLLLSVSAVLGILAFGHILNPVPPIHRAAHYTVGLLTIPIAAILGTLPATLAIFHAVPLLFIITNALFSLLMPLWIASGLLLLLFPVDCIAAFNDSVASLATNIVETVASSPWTSVTGIYLSDIAIIAFVTAIIAAAVAVNTRHRAAYATSAISAVCAVIAVPLGTRDYPDYEVTLAREPSATVLLLRQGNKAILVHTLSRRGHRGIVRRMEERLTGYMTVYGCDTVLIPQGDFSDGIYMRQGDVITMGSQKIALPVSSRALPDSIVHVDYLLAGRNTHLKPETLVQYYMPDTLLIAAEMPRQRTIDLRTYFARHYPTTTVIDLSTKYFTPHLTRVASKIRQ